MHPFKQCCEDLGWTNETEEKAQQLLNCVLYPGNIYPLWAQLYWHHPDCDHFDIDSMRAPRHRPFCDKTCHFLPWPMAMIRRAADEMNCSVHSPIFVVERWLQERKHHIVCRDCSMANESKSQRKSRARLRRIRNRVRTR